MKAKCGLYWTVLAMTGSLFLERGGEFVLGLLDGSSADMALHMHVSGVVRSEWGWELVCRWWLFCCCCTRSSLHLCFSLASS